MIRPNVERNEYVCKLLRRADLCLQGIEGAEELSEVIHSVEMALGRQSPCYFADDADDAAAMVSATLLEAEELIAQEDRGLAHVVRWVRQLLESEH